MALLKLLEKALLLLKMVLFQLLKKSLLLLKVVLLQLKMAGNGALAAAKNGIAPGKDGWLWCCCSY